MSFYSGNCSGCKPGPIANNPLNGLCEKACIETKKVFDACMKQVQENDVSITVTDFTPADPVLPLTFVSCSSDPANATVSNLVVDRFDDKPCFARVTGTVNVPVTINYTDANGTAGSATGSVSVSQDVVLYVPQPSIVPYQVETFANLVCADGEFVGEGVFSVDICLTLITKVVVVADILVPTYGYCQVPPCQEYTQDVCSGFFDLPLYPAQQPVGCPNNTR